MAFSSPARSRAFFQWFYNLKACAGLYCSAGNNFSLFTGHMSFQIFLLVGHLTNWAGHKTLTDNAL